LFRETAMFARLSHDNRARDARICVKENTVDVARSAALGPRNEISREIFDSRTFTRVHSGTSTEKRSSSGRNAVATLRLERLVRQKIFTAAFTAARKRPLWICFQFIMAFHALHDCTVTSYRLARDIISPTISISYISRLVIGGP